MASAKRLAQSYRRALYCAQETTKSALTRSLTAVGHAARDAVRSNVFGAGFGGSEHRELQPRLVCITDWRAERENSGLHCSMACTKDAYVVTPWPRVCPEGDT